MKTTYLRPDVLAFIGLYAIRVFALAGVPQVTQREASVEGIVLDSETSKPVANATVTILPDAGTSSRGDTDQNGKFSIKSLSAGHFQVRVARPGFIRPQRSAGPEILTIAPGEQIRNIRLSLVAAASISGRILDEDGQPKPSTVILAEAEKYEKGVRVLDCMDRRAYAISNERGEFRLFGLEPGEYYLAVGGCGESPQYYPGGVSDPVDATKIRLSSGAEQIGINVRLKPRNLYSVSFRLDPPSMVPKLPVVQVNRRSSSGLRTTEILLTNAKIGSLTDGAVRLGTQLPKGSYDIYYSPEAGGFRLGHLSVDVVDRDVNAGLMSVRPSTAIQGEIRTTVGSLPTGLRIHLTPLDGRSAGMDIMRNGSGRVKPDGTFAFQTIDPVGLVAEGRYQVEVLGLPLDFVLLEAKYEGRNVIDAALVTSGESTGHLELKIGFGGTVVGSVENGQGQPVAGSQVVLIPSVSRRENLTLFKASSTDQNGQFSIKGVAPGDYGAFAWEDVEPGAYQNAEFLRNIEPRAVKVTVIQGITSTTLNVRVIPNSKN